MTSRYLVVSPIWVLICLLLVVRMSFSYSPRGETNQIDNFCSQHAEARNVRTRLGHEAALPLYQTLLRQNPNDVTAASRLAAAPDTCVRHNAACPFWKTGKIRQLQQMLQRSQYNHASIQNMFGVMEENTQLIQASGPLYLKPPMAGASIVSPLQEANPSSLQCLVTLFLLGIAVPRKILLKALEGGKESLLLLEELGLAFPCQVDPELVVPHVHLFPMDIILMPKGDKDPQESSTLILATDLHPRVLSTTTVGTRNHGTVMYIGPDSLALAQHHYLEMQHTKQAEHMRVLDFCTGSGVQALSTLLALTRWDPHATATCVDCNERALQFTKFNAALNGMGDRVEVFWGDLLTGECRRLLSNDNGYDLSGSPQDPLESLEKLLLERTGDGRYDIVLANPPFIPVPPQHEEIAQRYGLFSSGGYDGEQVLRSIVGLASKLLKPQNGLLALVSEFMNPPQSNVTEAHFDAHDDQDVALLHRIRQWWTSSGGRGVLFTNHHPIDAETYATRRADTREELEVWLQHLSSLGITHVSPGLLFVRTALDDDDMKALGKERLSLFHRLVPKTNSGSIWTPSNAKAVAFTNKILSDTL